jgi:curved DNA-binding protein CbpA
VTLYEVLGVTPNSTSTDIEAAYAKRRGTSDAGFLGRLALALKLYADIDYAYSILSNQKTRQHYDTSPNDFLEFYRVAIVI